MRRCSTEQHGDAQGVSVVPCRAPPGLGDQDGTRMGPGWGQAAPFNRGACRRWSRVWVFRHYAKIVLFPQK